MLKKILILLIIVVGGFVAYAATRPDTYHVERSAKMQAPASVVFAQLEDLKSWSAWSPWEKRDPQMKKTFEGPASGVGSSFSWSGNKEVGKGKITITQSEPSKQIQYRLEFMEPFAAVATSTFTLAAEGDKAAAVNWAMDGNNNLMGKIFGIFMNMDTAIGADFEKGLQGLKTVAEAEATKQEAEAKAKAAAEAVKVAEAAKVKAEAEAAEAAAAAATAKGKNKPKH